MKREEIEEKYKWDLSRMYKTEEDFMQDFKEVKDELPNIEKYKGKFLGTSDRFIEFMNLLEKVNRKLEKITMSKQIYDENFKGKNWDSLSKEQFVFEGDTLYYCVY